MVTFALSGRAAGQWWTNCIGLSSPIAVDPGFAGLFGLSKRYPLGAEARAVEVDGANDLHGTARGQGVQVAPVP
jgi:hypothetical protein